MAKQASACCCFAAHHRNGPTKSPDKTGSSFPTAAGLESHLDPQISDIRDHITSSSHVHSFNFSSRHLHILSRVGYAYLVEEEMQ